jgi:transaldolase
MIQSSQLSDLIQKDGIRGVTSNPKIFDQVITGNDDYDDTVRELTKKGLNPTEIYRDLTVEDVQMAADLFRDLYDTSGGNHGFVSLEVNPHLAHDSDATVEEARDLWQRLDRPNVFIKVPATREGLPAITKLISEGINVNVTLLFGIPRYREVAEAYIAGLEKRMKNSAPIDRVRSVASFFLSRIDVLVDSLLEKRSKVTGDTAALVPRIRGQVAIASAREAYQAFKEIYASDRFQELSRRGAQKQRLLWASTSTKNPDYSDVKYVEALIGPETVNTVPLKTLEAFRDHGNPENRLENGLAEARQVLGWLAEVGIDLDQVTGQLEDEGVAKFNEPYDDLIKSLEREQSRVLATADQK